MVFASAGIATGAFEVLATTIGSGLVVGSFVGGLSTIAGRSRGRIEERALRGGYFGGSLALLSLVIDIVGKCFV
jgi:hypothetical protein